jgi:hypothetical protein
MLRLFHFSHLPQKQIKEVIQSQKIFGPPHLLAEIIHQSQGKPGFAVTLCRLCWESGTTRVGVLGTALASDLKLSHNLAQPAFPVCPGTGMSVAALPRRPIRLRSGLPRYLAITLRPN